jgi:hypothetical protein
MQHVMVVIPVDADVKEAQDVAEEDGQQWSQLLQVASMWYLHLQHHDRNDDCYHSITERFESPGGHLISFELFASRL